MSEARGRLPEGVAYVYIPTRPGRSSEDTGHDKVELELRRLADGANGLPVFTDLNLLVAQLGEFQPWTKIAVLELLIQISTVSMPVVINPVVTEDADRWTAERIEAWGRDGQ